MELPYGLLSRISRTLSFSLELVTAGKRLGRTMNRQLQSTLHTHNAKRWTSWVHQASRFFPYICATKHSSVVGSLPVRWLFFSACVHVRFHNVPVGLRLAIWLILCGRENQLFCLFATCCSSWVHINTGTSKRSVLLPTGDTSKEYVEKSNCMVARNFSCIHPIFATC